ncbi:MAG: hypothetical protein K6F43_02660 [Prevotella sp.]|nr:hypothetical protein [Prevotella sp.]
MKNIFKYAYSLLAGVVALTAVSCSDKYEYDGRGAWDAAENYADVYFPTSSASIELDPVDPTTATIAVKRKNTTGALSVSFAVTKNTDNVFEVGKAEFADGADETTLTVNFPKAEVGTPYQLQVVLNDPAYVSKYSKGITHDFSVTRVKWNDVGFYYDEAGNKVEGWAMYTDIVCGSWFGGDNLEFPTRLQERDDRPGYFRLVNTYDYHYPYNDPESAVGAEWQGAGVTREDCFDYSKNYNIIIDATNPAKVYMPSRCELGSDWGYGMFGIWDVAGLRLSQDRASDAEGNYGTYANGVITFPVGAILRSMADYNDNGLYAASAGQFKLVINPDLDLYTASIKNNDFTWEKVFTGAFISEKLGTTKDDITLYKGVAKADIEAANPGCYARFADLYGTVYKIEAPYADGSDIFFGVKDGEVKVIEGYETQALGFQAVGEDVYGKISAGGSTFTDAIISLKIVFQNKKGDIEYGAAIETLANLSWSEVGKGVYTYGVAALSDNGGSLYEGTENATLYQCNELPEQFILKPWGDSEDGLKFNIGEDGKIRFNQFTGYTEDGYGDVYFLDLEAYNPNYTNYLGEYDEEKKTYEFCGSYYIPEAGVGLGLISETFVLNDAAASAPKKAIKHKSGLKSMFKRHKLPSRFQPKHTLKNAKLVK